MTTMATISNRRKRKGETQYLRVFYFSKFIFTTFGVGSPLPAFWMKEKSNYVIKRVKVLQKSHNYSVVV